MNNGGERARLVKSTLILLVAVSVGLGVYGKYFWPVLEIHGDDIVVSFFASFLEDIIFFSSVGIVVIWWQTREPSSHALDEKIANLYSRKETPSDVIAYSRDEVKRIAGYCHETKQKIDILKWDAERRAIYLRVESHLKLRNMLHKDDYVDKEVRFQVVPDSIEGISPLGNVESIRWLKGEEKPVSLVSTKEFGKEGFTHYAEISLPPNGDGSLIAEYRMWARLDEAHYISALRYPQYPELPVEHVVDEDIEVCVSVRNPPTDGEASSPSEYKVAKPYSGQLFTTVGFRPPMKLEVHWRLRQGGEDHGAVVDGCG